MINVIFFYELNNIVAARRPSSKQGNIYSVNGPICSDMPCKPQKSHVLCILLGAPSREEPLEVVLDLGRARSGVQDLLAGRVYRWTREAPGAQPMRVQSVARVLF